MVIIWSQYSQGMDTPPNQEEIRNWVQHLSKFQDETERINTTYGKRLDVRGRKMESVSIVSFSYQSTILAVENLGFAKPEKIEIAAKKLLQLVINHAITIKTSINRYTEQIGKISEGGMPRADEIVIELEKLLARYLRFVKILKERQPFLIIPRSPSPTIPPSPAQNEPYEPPAERSSLQILITQLNLLIIQLVDFNQSETGVGISSRTGRVFHFIPLPSYNITYLKGELAQLREIEDGTVPENTLRDLARQLKLFITIIKSEVLPTYDLRTNPQSAENPQREANVAKLQKITESMSELIQMVNTWEQLPPPPSF